MNKKMAAAYRSYINSDMHYLYNAYDNYSDEKAEAWEECVKLCKEYDGKNMKIVGANTFTFSVGFEYSDPETGEAMFLWHTAYNTYTAKITPKELD